MKPLALPPKLVEQVRDAILAEVASGQLRPGTRIIQERLAADLGVSRQPVQQALMMLRQQGVLSDAPGRGLQVAPLDLDHVEHMYELRAVLEGLACRRAAQQGLASAAAKGAALMAAGRKAAASGKLAHMIAADMAFHTFLYELSGNPLVAPALGTQWTHIQRVMGEVLISDETPRDIWDQHERILQAIAAGDGDSAEQLARQHIDQAAAFMLARLRAAQKSAAP